MTPPVQTPRAPLVSRPRRAATVAVRAPAATRRSPVLPNRGRRQRTAQVAAERDPPPVRDRGLSLLFVFTIAMLLMVGLATLTAIVGRWWMVAPVMVVDLAATTAVLATIARLLADGDWR